MRYRAFVYVDGGERGGQPSSSRVSTNPVRCHLRPVKGSEVENEAGVNSIVAYEIIFWKKSADAAGISSGTRVQIDGDDYHIDFALPDGIGLKQRLICTATRV